jgi:predicted N-acetyltransferase YhbS
MLTSSRVKAVAIAQGSAEPKEVADLFRSAGLNGPVEDLGRLKRMLDEAQELCLARTESGLLVGLIRVLTDFSYNAFIADLAVRPDWQRSGLGTQLVTAVIADHPGVKFVVHPGHASGPFWSKLGFEPAPTCMAKPRLN